MLQPIPAVTAVPHNTAAASDNAVIFLLSGRCDRALEDLLGKMISYVRIIRGGGAALQTKFCSTRAGGTRAVLAPVQRYH